MARQIIKQPDGKFALWSTIIEDFIFTDASPAQIIEFLCEEARTEITKTTNATCDKLNPGEQAYIYQFTWEEAVEFVKRNAERGR